MKPPQSSLSPPSSEGRFRVLGIGLSHPGKYHHPNTDLYCYHANLLYYLSLESFSLLCVWKFVFSDIVPSISSTTLKELKEKTIENESVRDLDNVCSIKGENLDRNAEILMQCEQIYIEKVSNWLNKNEKRDNSQLNSNDCNREMCVDNGLISTQLFDPAFTVSSKIDESKSTNKIQQEDYGEHGIITDIDRFSRNSSKNVDMDIVEEKIDKTISKDHQNKISNLVEYEKENKCIGSKVGGSKRYSNRGKKCILSEFNKSEVETSLNSYERIQEVCDTISSVKPCHKEPEKTINMSRNVRFASEVKTRLLDCALSKPPSKLKRCSKAKKSPGWSRIEGARMDLRSNRSSLVIKGGAQRESFNKSTLSTSNLPESSQESQVVIEDTESPNTGQANATLNKSPKNVEENSFCRIVNGCETRSSTRDNTKPVDVKIKKSFGLSDINTSLCEQSRINNIDDAEKFYVNFGNKEEKQVKDSEEVKCQIRDLVGKSKNDGNLGITDSKNISSSSKNAVPKISKLPKGKLSRRIPKAKATSNLFKPKDHIDDNMNECIALTSGDSNSMVVDTDKCIDPNTKPIVTQKNITTSNRELGSVGSCEANKRGESCKRDRVQSPRSSVPFISYCSQSSKR